MTLLNVSRTYLYINILLCIRVLFEQILKPGLFDLRVIETEFYVNRPKVMYNYYCTFRQ